MKRGIVLLLALAGCGESPTPQIPQPAPAAKSTAWFVDATETSGLAFTHDAGLSPEKHLPETMGAGAVLFDCDEDGDLDLYLLQGGPMRGGGAEPGTFVEPDGLLPTNRLFLNDGKAHFTDATSRSGAAAHSGYAMGATTGDVNGDGHLDLYVTNLGEDVLLLGDGKGSFRDGTRESGLSDGRWTTAAMLFDAEGDGDLDLYVTGYVLVDLAHPLWCGERKDGWRSACHPDAYPALQDRLWINDGRGVFRDATASSGIEASFGKGLGIVPCDIDADGDLDLYIANDSTENFLWRNEGAGMFADGTLRSRLGFDGNGMTEAGMGLASGDVDEDGDFDLFVTNFDDESNTLYRNDGRGRFDDVTLEVRLEAPSRMPVGFGTVFEDFDLDGDLDLAVTNGHIIDNIHLYHDGKTHAQRSQLFANDGTGRFDELLAEAGPLGATPFVGRGFYAGDLDGDGDADLVLTQCGGPARLFQNVRADGAPSLVISGLPEHARVELVGKSGKRKLRVAGPQPSYFGACGPDVITALPGDELVELRIRPASKPEVTVRLEPLRSGRVELVREGDGFAAKVTRR
ncbi:MAG: VCBS repeat-containing protein [Planctomycetota bacterium]|nr:VCBS repeat-containing protein [Planctomycetota bacterium]